MEEFEAPNETADALAKKYALEKNDIVCGFLKEKEFIEMMHQEELNQLIEKFEKERESLRNEFELEKKDLLQGFHSQQVEKVNEFECEQESLKAKHANEYHLKERKLDKKFKEEKSKIRREFEDVIVDKNEEIKMLRRDLLRMQKNGDSFARTSPDCDVYIKRIEHETVLKRAKEEFDGEKLELERKSDREKAELVQVFTNQTERTNSCFLEERQRIQEDHRKELQFKLEVTERLLSEKFDLEKTRTIQQFEREIKELQESLEIGCKEKLLEKDEAIDELEKEKRELLNAMQIERFSLAQVYSRELSLLTQLDRPTKEDVEVALIDEIAKLKQEHDEALTEMDGQHKQRIEVIKRGQQPIKELEKKHRKEIENLKKQFENEKESFEAEFRKEQFNLLKSFEFERNDLEQRYEEMINEKELEIQQKEDDMRNIYEGELDGLKKIVEEQRKELEVSKQKLEDLASEMEEFASEKNRMEETFYKENNQCQNLEQNMQNKLQAFEKNMKETKALHHQELVAKMEEFAKEKDELRKNSENEKVNLQREIEILKGRLEEFQKTPEHFVTATSENFLENDFVEADAGDIACSYATGSNEPKTVENKSPLGENQEEEEEEEEGQLVGKENDGEFMEKTERKEKERPQRVQQKDVSKGIQRIQERLKECLTDKENEDTLEHLGTSNEQLKDAINKAILEMDKLCDDKVECDDVTHIRSQTAISPFDQLLALDDILTDEGTDRKNDNTSNDQLKEKIKAVLNNAHLSHEVEKLHLIERHQEELNELLKELADEKTKRVQETQLALKYLQENDQNGARTSDCVAFKVTEDKGTTTDDLEIRHDKGGYGSMKRPNSENSSHSSSNTVEEVRKEEKEMTRSIEELERHFKSEKLELMEKLQTQHKEFVMSADGEIIENLLKQKSDLEEAFNLERFYLGRLYYLEMKDELESALNRKTDKMKKDHNRDKMEIILKYEKDIADLQGLLSEKSEMELILLQDKNDALRKLLDAQRRSAPERNKAEKRRKDQDRLEREKENLDLTIPLKKEIADLQNKRQKEHETAVANLNNAIDLLKEVLSSTQSISEGEEKQNDRQRFLSEDPSRLVVSSLVGKTKVRNCKQLLVSDDEICNREELRAALENLVELVLNDEDSLYDSESTSGASSDVESEDSGLTTAIGESDEGAYSGPESTEDDALNIKKADLDFAFNLERFNLSRVYYGEYRDSLKKVMRKLAKAKDSLRNKRNDLENEMLNGIKKLVDKTQFANRTKQMSVTKRNIETQTFDINDIPSADRENLFEQGTEGERSLETEKRVDGSSASRGDNETSDLSQRGLKEEEQEDTKRKLHDKRDTPSEKPDEREKQLDHGLEDEKLATGIPQEEINQGDENKHEDHLRNNDINKDDSGEGIGSQPEPIFLEDGKTSDRANDRIGLDPGLGSNPNETKIVGEHGKEDTLAGGIDEVYTGAGLPAKRPDDGSIEKLHRNKGTKKEEAFRGNKDENEVQEKEEKLKTENSLGGDEEIGNNKSLQKNEERPDGHGREKYREIKNEDKDDQQSEAQVFDEDSISMSEHFNDNKEENAADDQTENEDGSYLMDGDSKRDRREKIYPSEMSDEGTTEGENYKEERGSSEKDGTNPKVLTKEEKPCIYRRDAACQTTAENDLVATGREMESKEAEEGIPLEESPNSSTASKRVLVSEPKPLRLEVSNPTIQRSCESREEGENLESNKDDENSEKPSNENTFDYPGDDNLTDSCEAEPRLAVITEDDESESPQSKSPVDEQDLIRQLNTNKKMLENKFNLLCELVGKEFVEEIPELKSEEVEGKDLLESITDLYAESEQLSDELKQVDVQIRELSATGSDWLADLKKRMENEEIEVLRSLGEVEKCLRRNDDKKLTEHLLKEKEDVCTKLDEISNLLNEQKEAMVELGSKEDKMISGLMCKMDALKDDLNEKAQQLKYKSKVLEAAKKVSGEEKENYQKSLINLKLQLTALEEGIPKTENYGHPKRESNHEFPTEIMSVVKSNADAEDKRERLEKEMKRTENEIERCGRTLEKRINRLRPFKRKLARIRNSLDLMGTLPDNESKKVPKDATDHVDDPVDIDSEPLLVDKERLFDEAEGIREKEAEIERRIEELDLAIRKIDLPYELKRELTDDITTAEKVGITQRYKVAAEKELQYLEEKISEEESKLREVDYSDPTQLIQALEEKEKLLRGKAGLDKLLKGDSSGVDEQNPDVDQLELLFSQRERLLKKIHALDSDISYEQHNFIDALQFKNNGKISGDSDSNIKGLIASKENLLTELKDTNEKILQSLSTGALRGPQSEFIEELVERKVKLEDEIDKFQEAIDDETARASEMLIALLEQKGEITRELKSDTERATDVVERLQESIADDPDKNDSESVSDEIKTFINEACLILNTETTPTITEERKELCHKQQLKENLVKGEAEKLTEAKRKGQDPIEIERALKNAIEEKLPIDFRLKEMDENDAKEDRIMLPSKMRKQNERQADAEELAKYRDGDSDTMRSPTSDNAPIETPIEEIPKEQNERSETDLPLSTADEKCEEEMGIANKELDEETEEKRRELEENLSQIENRLEIMLQGCDPSNEPQKCALENVTSLIAKKAKLKKDLQLTQLFEDLLKQKELSSEEQCSGSGPNKDGYQRKIKLGSDLNKLNDMIDRRERKIQRIEAKKDAKEEQLKSLNCEIKELDEEMQLLKETITTAKVEVEAALEEIQANIREQERFSDEEQLALNQQLEVLENEIEQGNQELQEVEGELILLKQEVHESKDSIHVDILDLEKSLVEKDSLRDYLAEIDRALDDNYDSDSNEQEHPDNIEELREKKNKLKLRLDDVQKEKTKLHIGFEDEEMKEVMDDLKQQKRELEARKEQISDIIRESGVVGMLAEKVRKNGDFMPRFHIHGILADMARGEKTLIELIKEGQDLKLAAQRQSEHLKNMIDSLSSKIGENLVSSLVTLDPEENESEDEYQNQAVIDEIEANGVTISEILTDLSKENKQLSDMNGELNSDLETLKEIIGEELIDALLSERPPSEEVEFEDVVDAVRNRGETLESILREQKGKNELIEDMLGKDLLSDILDMEDKPHSSSWYISAPAVMRKYDEDLENVIKAYEKELDNLSRESSLLKENLGTDLSRALLQMSKMPKTPISIEDAEQELQPRVQDGKITRDELLEKKTLAFETTQESEYSSQEDADSDITPIEETESEIRKKGKRRRKRKMERIATGYGSPEIETLDDKDHKIQTNVSISEELFTEDKNVLADAETPLQLDGRSSTEPNYLPPILDKILSSHFDSPADRHTPDLAVKEEEIIKQPLNAPLIMRASGKTLEDVIAQYERNLEKPVEVKEKKEAGMSVESSIAEPDNISEIDENVKGIVDAQKKNTEMLHVLKERLGADLVHALIDDKQEGHLDDLVNDEIEGNVSEMHQSQSEITEQQHDDRQPQKDKAVFSAEGSLTDVMDDKEIVLQKNQQGESTSNARVLRAPNIALENRKTLSDVIASYEDGLDSLRSKLGPSLTNTLLGMETPSTEEGGARGDEEGAKVPQGSLTYGETHKERKEKAPDMDLAKENDIALPDRGPVLFSTEGENCLEKELRAPELMATSGKTLEEVIEDYEDSINEEISELQSLVGLLKDKLGNDLYHTLLPHSNFRDEETLGKDEIGQGLPSEHDLDSLEMKSGESKHDFKSKSLLKDDGETVENILRKYEKQIDELSSLVTGENDGGVSISQLISNYEDKISDLEKDNEALADRLSGLAKLVGRNLIHRLENLENEDFQKKEEVDEVGQNDDINAPIMMQKNDQTLEKVLKNYEKELEALRKLYSNQGENNCLEDIIRDYEEKIDDLKSKNKDAIDNYDKLANKVGNDLVQDILASLPDENHQSDNEMPSANNASHLNAPFIMKRDVDSSLQDVLELYEKALGLFPGTPNDDNFVDAKMRTFDDLKRENKILKGGIGDQEVTDLILTAEEETQATAPTKRKPDSSKYREHSSGNGLDDKPVSPNEDKPHDTELERHEDPTTSNAFKTQEKELETIQKSPTAGSKESDSFTELIKELEDRSEELENEKKNLVEMMNHIERNIGSNLTSDLRNLNRSDKESDRYTHDDKKSSNLEAPVIMKNENSTLEDILKNYEKELEVLRKLVPDQGEERRTISDIMKDYEDKLENLTKTNNALEDELRGLRGKIGDGLFEDLQPEVHNLEVIDGCETSEKNEVGQVKAKRALKAIEILNNSQEPLEDIVAMYEKGLEDLKRENKVYRDGIGKDLAEALLVMAEKEDCFLSSKFDVKELEALSPSTEDLSYKCSFTGENKDVRKSTDTYKEDTQGPSQSKFDTDDTKTHSDELKAISLLRDEGLNLETILKRYEKELGALGQITTGENEDDVNVSDLIANLQNSIERSEDEKRILLEKLQHLEDTVGAELYSALDCFKKEREKDDEKVDSCDERVDINVINVMKYEEKNLGDVINNYEKELLALRKLVQDEKYSVADVIKEYEEKIKGLQVQNTELRLIHDKLEENIGGSLFKDLKSARIPLSGSTEKLSEEQERTEKLQAKNRRVLPLERRIEFYEQDLDEKENEINTLKTFVGPRFAKFLLNLAVEKEIPLFADSQKQSTVDCEESKVPFTSMSPVKTLEGPFQSFDDNNNDEEDVGSIPGSDYLRAQLHIRDEGKTVEDVLIKYEKELGTRLKELSANDGVYVLHVTADYEEKISKLEKEKDHLSSRLDDIEQKIGTTLLNKIEQGEQEKVSVVNNENQDDIMANNLKAPEIMRNEEKTLETVINRYEKELAALRRLVPSDGEEVSSITDIVKSYEDKVDQLRAESERKRLDSDRLVQRIGPKLVGDIKKLNEISSSEESDGAMQPDNSSEFRSEKQDKDLKVTKIMDVKKSTLEDVLETYENALGVLLSDALPYSNESNTGNFIAEYNSPIEELKKENELLKNSIGSTLTERLLAIAKDDCSGAHKNESEDKETVEIRDPCLDESRFSKTSKCPSKPRSNLSSPVETTAEIVIIQGGQTIEDISKNYEEQGVLKSLVPDQSDKSARDLENPVLEMEKGKEDLKAPFLMQKECKSLENILRKYERELEALRKADPGQEGNTCTITGIVNEHEEKIEELKTQNESLKDELNFLREKIGPELAEDVMSMKSNTAKGGINVTKGGHRSNKTPKYKTTKIMQEKETSLVDVLESYETMLAIESDDGLFSSAEKLEILRGKVGSELTNELLLPQTENEAGMKQKWKAVTRLKEENTTLADIVETYELELERLTREKNAIEALVKDDENDGQSALDVISQYEDEIEHLKNQNIEMENKMSTLIARMGDNLVNDVLRLSFKEKTKLKSSTKALKIMKDEEKQLSIILQEYENEIGKLSRENETLKTIANTERGVENGDSITNLVTNYEMKIQELVKEKQDIETNFGMLADGVGRDVADKILNPSDAEETLPLNALKIMKNEQKTLAEVTKQYENSLQSMKREIAAMHHLVSEDSEKSSLWDKVSEYEDEISNLKNKVREQTLLEKKIGMDLAQQLKTLGKNRTEGIVLRAVEVMERKNDTTLEVILKDYENELEKKDHEILTLKELVSGDILSIATSQESEIDELKNIKKILAKELDVLSDKVGRELVNEILNTSNKTPTTESHRGYHNVVQRMEDEEKSLADVLDEYEMEIVEKRNENDELTKKEATFTKLYDKIGSDLLNEILMDNLPESSRTDVKPPFEALALIAEEDKTLGEVILGYERELNKLKRENGALYALTEKESLADRSALSCFSEYEEKIQKLSSENLESNKRLQKLTLTVGVELVEELLNLPDRVNIIPLEPINDLEALRTVEENQITLARVLQNYEDRLKEKGNVGVGPLVFRKALTEDVKLAQIVYVDEKEPIITISEDERNPKSQYREAEERLTLEKSTKGEEIQSDDQHQVKTFVSEKEALRLKLRRLTKRVGAELAEELMRSQEDDSNDMNAAVTFASVRELDAFNDVVTERVTLAQVLESYEMQLKKPHQVKMADFSGPVVESHIVSEDSTRANSAPIDESASTDLTLPSSQLLEEVCGISDQDDVNHYFAPNPGDANLVPSEERASLSDKLKDTDDREKADLCDMDISALNNLFPKEPKITIPNEESLPPLQVQEVINEEIISVEVSRREEHFNLEYMEEMFSDNLPEENKNDQSEVPNSIWSEKYLAETKAAAEIENENEDVDSLRDRVKELEKALEEERNLKQKYEKDIQDLLQDIVDLKMKKVEDDDGETPEETRKRIMEEIELKQDNKQLQEDLTNERKRRLSIEESKRDLLDELNSLMREKELLLKQQNEDKENGKLLEDLINLRKKIGELDTENKRLKKEVKELKEALSEVIVTHDEEKNKVLEECEKEKSEMMEELVASKRELESQLQELFAMNDDLKGTINSLQEELRESSERFSAEIDVPNENGEGETLKDISHGENRLLSQTLKQEGEDEERSKSIELQNLDEQWKTEKDELQEIFKAEKERLQKTFDEELKRKLAENDEQHKQKIEEMTMEINRKFSKEKKEVKSSIERRLYEQLLDKNIAAETDFQEILSKILQEHSKEIENVENDIQKAEERFQEDKNKLLEKNDSEKEALKKMHEEEKKALESTIQNLLKEVVKLKHQRKEIRMIHKKEKETMEEIYERDRIKLKEDWELYKRDLLSKLEEEFDIKLANETQKLETNFEDLKEQLVKAEHRRKELEDRLKGYAIDSDQARVYEDDKGGRSGQEDKAYEKELRSVKKTLEEEYDKKLKEQKLKFEETLQGLRREIGNLQEKRRLIQDKIYNQDPSLVDRNLVEKSIANYKMDILSKMEEEFAQKIAREKKSLEETISEQKLEIDELKRQRWELRNQLRRDRSNLEEEFELEKERMENQFLKEKEELKNKLEARLQREMTKRTEKVNRAISPIFTESPYSPQDSPRRLKSENLALRDNNQRLELEMRQLTSQLQTLESNFQEIMYSERTKVEKMKRIQERIPKKVTFSDEVETRSLGYTAGDPNETVLQELRHRDSQVRELLEQKHFYEEVLSELCEEAGLFELDQNVVI